MRTPTGRTATGTEAGDPRRPRPVLTGRAMVLGALVVLLVIVLASPLQRYLSSRSSVTQAAQQLHHDRAQLARLRALQQRFGNPGYIEQLAREKLQFAMPGDTVYTVQRAHAPTQIERTRGARVSTVAAGPTWNARLWTSVLVASK